MHNLFKDAYRFWNIIVTNDRDIRQYESTENMKLM